MFLVSLCLGDQDLERLGATAACRHACVAPATAALSALHRVCAQDSAVARAVGDVLDLRHLERVLFVRDRSAAELRAEARGQARLGRGESLAGWAWALVTDDRPEVIALGQRLMADVYVRGLRSLAAPTG